MNAEQVTALLDVLEGHRFSAEVNVASDLRQARKIVANHETVRHLVALVERNAEGADHVLERIRDLCDRALDPRYESPVDAALFALLYVIRQCVPTALEFSVALAARAPQTWWTRHFVDEIRGEREARPRPFVFSWSPAAQKSIEILASADEHSDQIASADFFRRLSHLKIRVFQLVSGVSRTAPQEQNWRPSGQSAPNALIARIDTASEAATPDPVDMSFEGQ